MPKVKVKNGTIILPAQLRKTWEDADVEVRSENNKIILEKDNDQRHNKVDTAAWKRAAGILKGHKHPDPVKWQREIRKEWERKLP